jgi:hypothetical protein
MPLTQNKLFKVALGPLMLLFCLVVLHDSYRATARLLLLFLLISYVHFLWTSRTQWMRLIFVGFLIAAFLPIDVTVQNYPGPPRFVPLIMGSPRDEDIAREERGEVVLGGCILRENPPQGVLVW